MSKVARVWGFFAPFLTRLEGSTFSLSVSSVLHPFSDSQSSARVSLSCYLKATVLYWIWHARNLATFRNAVLSSAKIVANIKRDISLRILASRETSRLIFGLWIIFYVRFAISLLVSSRSFVLCIRFVNSNPLPDL